MFNEEFLKKYKGDEVGYWAANPGRLFWARLYDAPPELAVSMAKDFLLTNPQHESVAVNQAREVLGVPKMLNSTAVYVETGKRAALAMNQRDGSRYEHEAGWFRRAKALEVGFNKELAQRAYDEGYSFARVTPMAEHLN
ncbi:hypothetical protein [Ottowia sp.]|uniref:hypothetical protein n=1 Tax=Ottowia sp. TaxID=1898956 RepID=UPI0026000F34|nr:hypothetical protein [Ottowia sp.]MBK6616407.1 hypothetical protein [Ottowia sp.]